MRPIKLISVETDADFSDLTPDDNFLTKSNESGKVWIGQTLVNTNRAEYYENDGSDIELDTPNFDTLVMSSDNDALLLDGGFQVGQKLNIINVSGASIDIKMKTGETETIYDGTITLADGEFCAIIYVATKYGNLYARCG